jgi:uncharacterized protein (TIGR03086 family)
VTLSEVASQHLRACSGFSLIVAQGEGRWDRPSPCPEWNARGLVEHVIGFHDVLVLRPLGAKPERRKGDPIPRWEVTSGALSTLLNGYGEHMPTSPVDLPRLLPALRTEVLVHSWDLAMALGVDAELDEELCAIALKSAQGHEAEYRASGMFSASVSVTDHAPVADRLVALLGRDPGWRPSSP